MNSSQNAIAFDDDGVNLNVLGAQTVSIVKAETLETTTEIKAPEPKGLVRVAIDPDGEPAWEVEAFAKSKLTPSGRLVALASQWGVDILNAEKGQIVSHIETDMPVEHLEFSDNLKFLRCTGGSHLFEIDLTSRTGKVVAPEIRVEPTFDGNINGPAHTDSESLKLFVSPEGKGEMHKETVLSVWERP